MIDWASHLNRHERELTMSNQHSTITEPVRQLVLGRVQKADESQLTQLIFSALAENCVDVNEVSLAEMKQLLVDAVRAKRTGNQFNAA